MVFENSYKICLQNVKTDYLRNICKMLKSCMLSVSGKIQVKVKEKRTVNG